METKIKGIMEEVAWRPEQSNRTFCTDGSNLIAAILDSVFYRKLCTLRSFCAGLALAKAT